MNTASITLIAKNNYNTGLAMARTAPTPPPTGMQGKLALPLNMAPPTGECLVVFSWRGRRRKCSVDVGAGRRAELSKPWQTGRG